MIDSNCMKMLRGGLSNGRIQQGVKLGWKDSLANKAIPEISYFSLMGKVCPDETFSSSLSKIL